MHTSVPRTGKSSRLAEDTLDQGSTVVCALGTDGLDGATSIDKENLSVLNALYFDFLLGSGGQGKGRDTLELVLLGSHVCRAIRNGPYSLLVYAGSQVGKKLEKARGSTVGHGE